MSADSPDESETDSGENGTDDSPSENAFVIPHIGRGIRIRRLRLIGVTRNYEVDFVSETGTAEPCSIIAGRTNTGKTSVLRFIAYALGGSNYPTSPEVLRQVRSVVLEIQTPDGLFTIERALDGRRAQVFPSAMDEADSIAAATYVIEPISDPSSLSQFLLSTVNLQDVNLKEAPTQEESSTDRLSFRDLMWLCLFLNERIGTQQLLHAGNVAKTIKLRQVVDAVFGVHDNDEADLSRRIRDAQTGLEQQRRSLEQLQEFVTRQEPKSNEQLEVEAAELAEQLSSVRRGLRALGQREAAASAFASELRDYHATLSEQASQSAAKVRDRISTINRFASLRAQYADDVRKLTLLVEAESVFNQLSV